MSPASYRTAPPRKPMLTARFRRRQAAFPRSDLDRHLVDLVGRMSGTLVHPHHSFTARARDEAERLPRLGVKPCLLVVDALLALDRQVGLVSLLEILGGCPDEPFVHVHEGRHLTSSFPVSGRAPLARAVERFRRQYERSCYLVNMDPRPNARKPRSDGQRSREAILSASAKLATVEGLRGLTIGGLAEATGMSKSGLYAHFGSKEELQLATIDAADEIFEAEVVAPATASGGPVDQILQLSDRFLDYVGSDVFPGGCFFAAASAEIDTHPGRVKERIAEFQAGWMGRFIELLRQAQAAGEIDAKEDPMQLG